MSGTLEPVAEFVGSSKQVPLTFRLTMNRTKHDG